MKPSARHVHGVTVAWRKKGEMERWTRGGGLMGIKHIVLVIKTEAEEFKDGNEEVTGGLVDYEPTPSCEVFTIKAVNTCSS